MELHKSYSWVITPNLDFDSSAVLLQTFFTGMTLSNKLSLRMRNGSPSLCVENLCKLLVMYNVVKNNYQSSSKSPILLRNAVFLSDITSADDVMTRPGHRFNHLNKLFLVYYSPMNPSIYILLAFITKFPRQPFS